PEKYARVIDLLNERYPGMQLILTGGPADKENNQKIADLCRVRPLDLAGKTDLKALIAVISKLKCFISVDTGPMHVAAALKVPVVAISPVKYVKPTRWGPYRTDQVIIRNTSLCNIRCNPYKCDLGECMNGITPQMVFEGVEKVLTGHAVRAADFKEYHIKKSANILICDDTRNREGKKYYEILSRSDYSVLYLNKMPALDFIPKHDINIIHVFSARARWFFKLLRPFVSPYLSNPPVIYCGESDKMSSGKELVEIYLDHGN
ncbi:MAG TPA: glycosyltransferase family 9 protein, partial [Candidatus Sulfotelmatobacter sp.]|nr:glycosyltransferase family 9 protein [Candidatus Sulfotelmatobacter sp.]